MPEAAGDEQQVAAARVDLERPAERPEHVDRVARPQPGEPVGAAPDDPEVDRDDARSRRRPCSARTAGAAPAPSSRPVRTWTNWPAREPVASPGAWYAWSHWPGRISRLSTSSAAASRMVTRSGGPRRASSARRRPRRRRRRSPRLGASLGRRRPRRRRRRVELGRDGREGLGERVGQVAEDVGRVVELDELLGARQRPPLAVGVLGDDLGPELPVASATAARRRRRR